MLIFQSMHRGSSTVLPLEEDYDFEETDIFHESGYPKLHFVEREYAHDWTNWWVPNRAGAEAMLRASGFAIETRVEDEVYICRRTEMPYSRWGRGAAYPARDAALRESE